MSYWGSNAKADAIAELEQHLPNLVHGYVGNTADTTATWYESLAPDESFAAGSAAPDDIVPAEKIAQNIQWAVNTATTVEAALAQLQGTMQRSMMDAQRHVVAKNAEKEGVLFLRHTNYAGACNWCLTLATKGAVYKTAAAAIKGHDNCKCIAVPLRKGGHYTTPPMVVEAEQKYIKAKAQLEAQGKSASLDNIVKQMDNIDQGAKTMAEVKKTQEWLNAEKAFKKKESKAKAAKKFAEKKKAEKVAAAAAEVQTKIDTGAWLAAEAQFKAEQLAAQAKVDIKKQAKAAASKKHAEKKKAEKAAAAAQFNEPAVLPPAPGAIVKPPPPDMAHMSVVGPAGGSHGATIYETPDGKKWLVKKQSHYKNVIDETTADLQDRTGLHAPDVYTTKMASGAEVSVQQWLPGGNAFSGEFIPATKLSAGDKLDLQKSQVLDWLVSNHDSHAQQWVRNAEGHLVGIDKGQAFKWFGKDKLDWNFHPNKAFNEHESAYNTLWKAGLEDKALILNPAEGELGAYIQAVQSIPDAEFRAMLKPMATETAKAGKLVSVEDGYGLLPGKVPPNDVEAFLNAAVARKNNLQNDFDNLYKRYLTEKTGKAPDAPLPPPAPPVETPAVPLGEVAAVKQEYMAGLLKEASKYAKLTGTNNFDNPYWKLFQETHNQGPSDYLTVHPHVADQIKAKSTKQAVAPAAKALEAEIKKTQDDIVGTAVAFPDTQLFSPGNHVGVAVLKLEKLEAMSPVDFAAQFPEKVIPFAKQSVEELTATHQKLAAEAKLAAEEFQAVPQKFVIGDTGFTAMAQKVVNDNWGKLGPVEKKKVGKQLAAAKHAAKKKGDLAKVSQFDAMTPAEYHSWKNGALPFDFKAPGVQPTFAPPTVESGKVPGPAIPPPPPTVPELSTMWAQQSAEVQKKAGKQLAAAKFQVKKKLYGGNAALLYEKYGQWTPKDWWAAQQLKANPLSNPVSKMEMADIAELQLQELKLAEVAKLEYAKLHPETLSLSVQAPLNPYDAAIILTKQSPTAYKQYLLENGQTTLLSSPIDATPLTPTTKISAAPTPKNPPNDPLKIAKVQQMYAAHPTPGFNPVKAIDPTNSLKTNIDTFDAEIGVGYLTDEQFTQVVSKLPKTYQSKYLKKYAEAKGQPVADAIQAKIQPAASPTKVSAPTSAGSKPAYGGANWKANVPIKAGTNHTPVRSQAGANVVKKLNGTKNHVVSDPTAELGSSANPHVFDETDSQDYKTFGALITDQNEGNWIAAHLKPIKAYTGSKYGSYNDQLRNDLAKMLEMFDETTGKMKIDPATGVPFPVPKVPPSIKNLDAAFSDPTCGVNEEWMVLSRGASRREFNDNDVEGLAPYITGGHHGTVAEMKALEGHTYVQRGIGSTSISDVPAFKKHVRVIYRVPPGTKMVYVDGQPGYGYGSGLTSCSGEKEVLLARNTRCKVLEVRDSTHQQYKVDVVVEIIGQETWP